MTRDQLFTPCTNRKPSTQLDGRAQRIVATLPESDACAALLVHFSDFSLAPQSIRYYQNLADRCVDLLAARGDVPTEDVAPVRAEMRAAIAQAPRPDVSRTSAAKMCLAPAWQIETVIERLERKVGSDRNPLMGELTWRWAAVLWALACRPSEPFDMQLAPGDLLVLPNRKEDEFRCDGPLRVLRLGACGRELLEHVRRVVEIVATMRAAGRTDEKILQALAARLAAVSTKAGFGRMCAYTMRHSAIARWREEGVEEEEIRRRLGHADDAARRHYSKPRRGLRIAGRTVAIAAGDAHDLATACAALGIVIEDAPGGAGALNGGPGGDEDPAGEAQDTGVVARRRRRAGKAAARATSRPVSPPAPSAGGPQPAPTEARAAGAPGRGLSPGAPRPVGAPASAASPTRAPGDERSEPKPARALAAEPRIVARDRPERDLPGPPSPACIAVPPSLDGPDATAAPGGDLSASAAILRERRFGDAISMGDGRHDAGRPAASSVPGQPVQGPRRCATRSATDAEAARCPADKSSAPFRQPAVRRGPAPLPLSGTPPHAWLRRAGCDEALFPRHDPAADQAEAFEEQEGDLDDDHPEEDGASVSFRP